MHVYGSTWERIYMDKIQAAKDVAERLAAAESAIDEAVRTGADLLSRLSTARQQMNLSAVVGGDAFQRSAAALTALTAARAETAACHDALARIQVRVGLGALAGGSGEKPPPVTEVTARGAQVAALPMRRA